MLREYTCICIYDPHTHRFLRHVIVIYVDHPAAASLRQIYGTFNRAMLEQVPNLEQYAYPLTDAMVEFYTMYQVRTVLCTCGDTIASIHACLVGSTGCIL